MKEGLVKAAKGLIRAEVRVKEGVIESIRISGDFFLHPPESLWELERVLIGVRAEASELRNVIKKFFDENHVETPLVEIEDFVRAILRGAGLEET